MVGDAPEDAVGALLIAYQRVISCVSQTVLLARRDPTDRFHFLLHSGDPVPPRLGRDRRLSLRMDVRVRATPAASDERIWQAEPAGYRYELLDEGLREIVAYHWHPIGASPVRVPHLHVGGRTEPTDLSKIHLPTGGVDVCDLFACLITEFGVRPFRLDWQRVIDDARRRLNQ